MLPSVPLRQVARIDNNLNQIVRWANTYASEAEVGEVGAHWLGSVRTAAISDVNRLLQTVYIFRDGALPPIMSTGAKRISLPATGAYVGNPSSPLPGEEDRVEDPTSTQHTAKAAEGSQNQPESTLTLPSDCPTK